MEFSLTRDLPLKVELNMQKQNADGTGWATTSYRKTGEEASPTFVRNVLAQLQVAFLDRSAWALQMERTIFNVVTKRDGRKPSFDLQVAQTRTAAVPLSAAAIVKAD